MDRCVDGKPAKLFLTYGIKENGLVLVQAVDKSKEVKGKEQEDVEMVAAAAAATTAQEEQHLSTPEPSSSLTPALSTTETTESVSDIDRQQLPKEEGGSSEDKQYRCKTCHNNDELNECTECGCSKCLKKSGILW